MKEKTGSLKAIRSRVGVRAPLLALAFSLLPATAVQAAKIHPSAGSTSATFLKIGVGARAVAMGGAFTAVTGDPYALYWNPAGLAGIGERTLAFTHNDYFAGMGQEYISYIKPSASPFLLPDGGVCRPVSAMSLNYFHTGKDLERRSGLSESANVISASEGKFGAYDMAFTYGAGRQYSRRLRGGAAVKLIRQSIDDESALGAALDLGALYDFTWRGRKFTAGAALVNAGPGMRFISKTYDLPLAFKAGLGHRLPGGTLLALDLAKPVDNYPSLAAGLEHPLAGRLLLRAGYRYRQYGNESGGVSGLALGLGFAAGRFSFDYALAPFGELGNTHRISAALRFLAPDEEKKDAGPKAASALSAGSALAVKAERRPLAITRAGVTFVVKAAVTGGAGKLSEISFVGVDRGLDPAEFGLTEGNLPGRMLGLFPRSGGPDLAWQFLPAPRVSGDIKFGLSLPPSEAGGASFHYFDRGEWKTAELREGECSDSVCRRYVSAPLAQAYALVFAKPQ